jgi:hypothetical protein
VTNLKEGADSGSMVDKLVDVLTARVTKITGLIVAIGGLTAALVQQFPNIISLLIALGILAPLPCVQVVSTKFPDSVNLSEWDNAKVEVRGRNNCNTELGLYLVFIRDSKNERLFTITARHSEFPECRTLASDAEPKCWDPKKPVRIGKGEWSYGVPLPHIERVGNPQRLEKILMGWYLHDYDAPAKAAIAVDTVTIVVHNDADNRS